MSRLVLIGLVGATVLGCAAEPESESGDNPQPEAVELDVDQELPPMPGYPVGRPGYLVAVSAGADTLGGIWEARAEICREPPVIEFSVDGTGAGTLVAVFGRDSVLAGNRFPIQTPDSTTIYAGSARLAAQRRDDVDLRGFQAVAGHVELDDVGDVATARFAVTLREFQSHIETQYVGVLEHVPVRAAGSDYCEGLATRVLPNPVDSIPRDVDLDSQHVR